MTTHSSRSSNLKASLSSAYALMMKRVKEAKPEARIEGVYIQRQITQGQEAIVGMVRDPQFGVLMMFGSGGVEVEELKNVAFALASPNQAEAEKMIRKTWAGRKLKGFRSSPLLTRSRLSMSSSNYRSSRWKMDLSKRSRSIPCRC